MQIAADFLLFDQLTVDLYSLDAWLAEEVRDVLRIYWANKAKEK